MVSDLLERLRIVKNPYLVNEMEREFMTGGTIFTRCGQDTKSE